MHASPSFLLQPDLLRPKSNPFSPHKQNKIASLVTLTATQDVATFVERIFSAFPTAAEGMTTSGGSGDGASAGTNRSAFSDDGTALNEDISFLLQMANATGVICPVHFADT